MKLTPHLLVMTGLVALVFIAASLEDPQDSVPVAAPAQEVRPSPAPPRETMPEQRPSLRPPPSLAAPEEIPGEEGEQGEFTTTTDVVKAKIFKTEPELARFDYFRAHVLLDSNARRDYEALLADPRMYEQMRRALSSPSETDGSYESSLKRLMRIDYLREALTWKQNPAREQLVSTVEDLLLENSFSPRLTLGVKRSMAATRMELYELFADQEPERARALVEAAKGTPLEKLLQYLAVRNLHRLDKERELSVQAQRAMMSDSTIER